MAKKQERVVRLGALEDALEHEGQRRLRHQSLVVNGGLALLSRAPSHVHFSDTMDTGFELWAAGIVWTAGLATFLHLLGGPLGVCLRADSATLHSYDVASRSGVLWLSPTRTIRQPLWRLGANGRHSAFLAQARSRSLLPSLEGAPLSGGRIRDVKS